MQVVFGNVHFKITFKSNIHFFLFFNDAGELSITDTSRTGTWISGPTQEYEHLHHSTMVLPDVAYIKIDIENEESLIFQFRQADFANTPGMSTLLKQYLGSIGKYRCATARVKQGDVSQ